MADETTTTQEKTFTQADVDKLIEENNAKHQTEMDTLASKMRAEFKEKEQKAKEAAEKAAKQANMSELEKATAELDEYKTKYAEAQSQIDLTNQKDETRKLMSEIGVEESCLDYVFISKDLEGTKARVKAFKEYIDNVKKQTFENNVKSTIPGSGNSDNQNQAVSNGYRAAIEEFYTKK